MPAGSTLLRLATASATTVATAVAALGLATPAHAVTSDASAYLSRLNAERAAHGLHALTLRSDLDLVAQRWADHMAAAGTLSHNPNLASQVGNWQVVGENVGEGPTISALDSAFMASPAHRGNILDSSYRDVGIGTATVNGIIWITVDFRDPMYAESNATIARPHATRHAKHHRTLHVGSRGRDVAAVQRKVHAHADGIFGPKTRRAVIRWQRRHHLHANGVVGAATWKSLHL